ncbi:MAG: ABC transporter permease [Desulfobacterales bacterium]
MLTRVKSLVVKELLNALRDPKARAVLIGPPIIQILVFSFAMTQEAKNVRLAVLNLDHGQSGYELVQRFENAGNFDGILRLDGRGEIQPVLDEQRALAVLVIPLDFSRNLLSGNRASVQLLLDGRRTNTAQIVRGYAQQILSRFGVDTGGPGTAPAGIDLLIRHWFNPNLEFIWYTVPSLICILTTVVCLLLTSLAVAREREMGTFEQLLVSPLRPVEILIGKALPALVLSLGAVLLLLAIAVFGFRIPFQGSTAMLFGSVVIFLMSIIGIGLFISSLSLTQQQAILGAFMFMPPAVLLSGFATPIENMPLWLQRLTAANPLRWFLVIVRGIFLKDMPFSDVLANTVPMAAIALVTLVCAMWLFKHRME